MPYCINAPAYTAPPFHVYLWQGKWAPEDCARHPRWLFVFGDNYKRRGKLGQAVIRDCPNTAGIATKYSPSMAASAFFSDIALHTNRLSIDQDISLICANMMGLDYYTTLVLSQNGYGSGFAQMPLHAPQTYAFLCHQLKHRFGFDNQAGMLVNAI